MRHHNKNRKLGRKSGQRKALLKSLALSVIERGKIITTEAKAKEIRPLLERLVTLAKKNNLSARRFILARLFNNSSAADKLLKIVAPRYKERAGGYTRIVKLSRRRKNDAAQMAAVEFI